MHERLPRIADSSVPDVKEMQIIFIAALKTSMAMDGTPGGPMLRGRSGGEVLYGDGVLPLGGWGLNLRVVHFRAEGSRGGLAGT